MSVVDVRGGQHCAVCYVCVVSVSRHIQTELDRLSTLVRAHQPRSSRRPSSIKRVVLVIAVAVASHVKLLFVPHLVNASVSGVRGPVMFVFAKMVFNMWFLICPHFVASHFGVALEGSKKSQFTHSYQ